MIFFLLFVITESVLGVTSQCAIVDVKTLLEGCDRLIGLNVTSTGGTMVNDHNCDVLLPKQVFTEEPLFQYPRADSKKFYSILMVDPDAPPRIEGEFFLHMLKSNIPESKTRKSLACSTTVCGIRILAQSESPTIFHSPFINRPDIQIPIDKYGLNHVCCRFLYTIPRVRLLQGLALKAKEISKTVGIDYRGYKPPTPPRGTGAHRYMSLLYEQADGNNFLPSVPSSRNRLHLANWLRGKNLCGPVAATQFRVQY